MFESHGGLLSAESFATYCTPYLSQIAQRVKESLTKNKLPIVPMVQLLSMVFYHYSNNFVQIVFAKGSHYAVEELSKLEYDVIGIDWTTNAKDVRWVTASVMVTLI